MQLISENKKFDKQIVQSKLFITTIVFVVISSITGHKLPLETSRIAGILLFFFWPGWFVLKGLRWKLPLAVLSYPPLALGISMGLLYIASVLIFILKCPTNIAIIISLSIIYTPALFFRFRNKNPIILDIEKESIDVSRIWILLAGLVVLIWMAMAWPFRMEFKPIYDAGYFLTIARKFAELNHIELVSAHVNSGLVDRGYGLNAYLLSVGLLARLLSQDVQLIWGSLSIYSMFVLMSSFFLLTRRLFNSTGIGLGVMVFLNVYFFSGYYLFPPCQYANPKILTWTMCMVVIWIFTELVDYPSMTKRILFGLIGASILAVHPFGLMIAFVYICGTFLLSLLTERGNVRKRISRETVYAGLILTAFSLPYIAMKYHYLFDSNSPLFTVKLEFLDPGVSRFFVPVSLFGSDQQSAFYLPKPSLMLNNYAWLGWLGIPLLTILYFKQSKIKRFNANLLFGGIVLTVLIVFNPLSYKYLGKLWTVDLICRLIRKPPIHAIATLGTIALLVKLLLEKITSAKVKQIVIILLLCVSLLPALYRFKLIKKDMQAFNEQIHQSRKNFRYINAHQIQNDPLLKAIRKKLKPGETLFNTTVLAEIFLCPISNVKLFDLYKQNWASMNQTWGDHLIRHENAVSFYEMKSDVERYNLMHDLKMKYIITEYRQLQEPLFELLAHSSNVPRLFLYEVVDQEILRKK